jgi:recombination protein RecA
MARKKKEETVVEETSKEMSLAERLSKLDKLCKEVTDSGIAVAGRVEKSAAVKNRLTFKFIPTPIDALNEALGGGIVRGKFTTISGTEDSGKTNLMLAVIGKNMQEDPNFCALWVESEESLDIQKAAELHHIDLTRFHAIAPSRSTAAEGVANIIEAAIQASHPDLVVINTLKMLIPKSEIEKPMEKVSVAEQARYNASLIKKFITLCAETGTAMVFIQQLTTRIGQMYGDPLTLAGGLAIKYNSLVILDLRKCSIDQNDPITKETGMKIHATVKKNHAVIDRNPYCCVEYFVEYGKGIEQTMTLLKQLLEKGILTKRGAYIDLLDENGEQQDGWTWYGKKAFKTDMEENPEKLTKLKGLIAGSMTNNLSDAELAEIKAEEDAETEALGE